MAYCNDCKAMVKVETDTEVEIDDLQLSETGNVTCIATIADQCMTCHNELRSASFNVDLQFDRRETHDCPEKDLGMGWTVDVLSATRTERHEPPNNQRYKTYYGVELQMRVRCPCGEVADVQTFVDDVQVAQMEKA
jgi:hypothetical protein